MMALRCSSRKQIFGKFFSINIETIFCLIISLGNQGRYESAHFNDKKRYDSIRVVTRRRQKRPFYVRLDGPKTITISKANPPPKTFFSGNCFFSLCSFSFTKEQWEKFFRKIVVLTLLHRLISCFAQKEEKRINRPIFRLNLFNKNQLKKLELFLDANLLFLR